MVELSTRARTPLSTTIYKYLEHRKLIERRARASVTADRVTLVCFAGIIGARPIGTVRRSHVLRYVEVKTRAGVGDTTMRHYLSRLKAFARWVLREKYAHSDFMLGVPIPRTRQSQPRALPPEDVRLALKECPSARERLIITLMVQAGLRCVEVSRLRRCDIDLDGGLMLITGKGGGEQYVAIVSTLDRELRQFFVAEPVPAMGYVIRSRHDDRSPLMPRTIGELVSDIFKAAGVKQAPYDGRGAHSLRHALATGMLDNGADIREVQEALRHEQLTSTQVYVRRHRIAHKLKPAMEGRDQYAL